MQAHVQMKKQTTDEKKIIATQIIKEGPGLIRNSYESQRKN